MTELTEMPRKRELGDGRWDVKLKGEMVRLSKADNYAEAKHEWIATGNVWWSHKAIACVVTISHITLRYTILRLV